jgi:ADP-ribose pyrophosphatase
LYKIEKEKKVFSDSLIIEEGKIIDENNKKIKRLRINREDASAVFLVNTESDTVVLTKQFRYAINSKTSHQILEIAAGKIDEDESPIDAAIRETEEETGYKIRPNNIKFLLSCFVSPGYSSERFFIYYATVINADKISKGGGIEGENERIEIIELQLNEFKSLVRKNLIEDAKTYLAALYMKM